MGINISITKKININYSALHYLCAGYNKTTGALLNWCLLIILETTKKNENEGWAVMVVMVYIPVIDTSYSLCI